jgi:hypothetical protein
MQMPAETTVQIEAQLAAIENSANKIRELLERTGPTSPASAALAEQNKPAELTIKRQEALPDEAFRYRWPDSGMVRYIDATRYTVCRGDRDYVFVVGAEKGGRKTYQRDGRGRIVVFIQKPSGSFYPLVEFAESDDDADLYVAGVPRPGDPKKLATAADLAELRTVRHLRDADLKRADDIFASLSRAPSLRLPVRRDDTSLMIEHAWWVGRLRGTAP